MQDAQQSLPILSLYILGKGPLSWGGERWGRGEESRKEKSKSLKDNDISETAGGGRTKVTETLNLHLKM